MAPSMFTLEPSNVDTIVTTAACLEYRGVHISEASGIFLVGVAMHTHDV